MCYSLSVCLRAEARGLVRALLQPDPTVRLTAEQTLLHPWVKAMASMCRQRALTDKAQTSTADTEAEPERVQRQAQTNAAETMEDKRPGHMSGGREIALKQLRRADDKQTKMVTGRGHDEDKPPQQQSKEKSTVHTTSPQIKEHTLSVATPGQQKPQCTSTGSGLPSRREIQQPGPKLSHTDPSSPSVELSQLATTAQTTKLKQNSQQQSATDSPSSTNTATQTTAGHSTQHHSLSNTATSLSHSLHQQNFTSPLHNPTTATTQNHPGENHDKSKINTAITYPPTSHV